MPRLWNDYSLSITLALLFVASWVLQLIFQVVIGGEGITQFLASTFEHWQSEFIQLFAFVVLATYFIHKGSPIDRKDGDERIGHKLDEVLARLNDAAVRDYELAAAGETRGQAIQTVLERLEQRQDRRTTA